MDQVGKLERRMKIFEILIRIELAPNFKNYAFDLSDGNHFSEPESERALSHNCIWCYYVSKGT